MAVAVRTLSKFTGKIRIIICYFLMITDLYIFRNNCNMFVKYKNSQFFVSSYSVIFDINIW